MLSPRQPRQGQRLRVKLTRQGQRLRVKLTQQVRRWAMLLVLQPVQRLVRTEISLLPLELELELERESLRSLARLLRREQERRPASAQSAP